MELKDLSDEPFPSRLRSVRSRGVRRQRGPAGTQTFSPNPFDNPYDATQEFLVASDGAGLDATRDATLTLPLPLPSGTVCFTSGSLGRVHCVAYGCPVAAPTSSGGTQAGTLPPANQSLSRVSGSLTVSPATPNTVNNPGSSAACPVPPTGTTPGGAVLDTTRPRQTVAVRRRQDVDRVVVAVRSNEAARLTASASVNVPGAARVLRFRTVRRGVAAGVRTRVRLRLSRPRLRAVKRALRRGRRLTARVRLVARDGAGNSSTVRRSIRLTN